MGRHTPIIQPSLTGRTGGGGAINLGEKTNRMKSTEVQNPRRKMCIESLADNVCFCAVGSSMT